MHFMNKRMCECYFRSLLMFARMVMRWSFKRMLHNYLCCFVNGYKSKLLHWCIPRCHFAFSKCILVKNVAISFTACKCSLIFISNGHMILISVRCVNMSSELRCDPECHLRSPEEISCVIFPFGTSTSNEFCHVRLK